ncbi:helix-turn-helix domain-containing protein [Marinomonas sp. C2222]|uniref:Helix-turn-helix domain-containing protein n=1 Tax=Marinomonas sargassi TaxID=2984494 RepID=A0ABT2YQ04_9GAMM|nr:helix-turn-helix domain-containing protein [Marinomonas sargassi]MCV2401965.1 helix-turn-helix domain-containing protein [Marinomonas sargassi]
MTTNNIIHVYFILLPNTVLLDAIGPAEAFQYANRFVDNGTQFKLHFIGPQAEIDNSLGLNLQVSPLPEYIEPNSWIISPGMAGQEIDLDTQNAQMVVNWLAQQAQYIGRYISVCSGALLYAKAGLLNGRDCTTHHMHIEELQLAAPNANVLANRLLVADEPFYSCAGVTSGIDLAMYIIQHTLGENCACQVARHMVLFSRRGPNDPSQSPWLENRNHFHQGVHRIQDAIQLDPSRQWTIEDLANKANCSPRHLVRLFKENTGITTREYLYKLRLSLAMQLLQSSSLPIEDIAEQCGFNDPRQFRRIWARQYTAPPSAYRTSAASYS